MARRLGDKVWGGLALAGWYVFFGFSVPNPARADDTPQVPVNNKGNGSSSGTALDEIVVTARKQSETAQSIPASVRAIGATELANAHVERIDDLGSLVSNLNITTRADQTPDVVIRGVGAFGVTNGVGFYLDDVQLFDGQTVRPTDLDRVEVLKGPQGTLYGGNNIGGAIKYVTKLPTDVFHADGMLEYGDYNTSTISGAVSGPLIGETLLARVSAYETRTDGFIYDPILNSKLDRGKEYGGRITLHADSGLTTAILYLNASRLDTGASSIYYRPGPPNDAAATTNYSLQSQAGTFPDFQRKIYSATLSIKEELAEQLTLNSISSYFHSTADTLTDIDKGPLPFLTGYQHFDHTVWSQELRLSNVGSAPFRWLVGAFAQGNDPDTLQRNVAFIGDPSVPANLVDPTQFASQTTFVHERHREYALFGNAQLKLDDFDLEFGLRGDYSKAQSTDAAYGLNLSQDNRELVPKVSLSYHFTADVMGYGLISRGFQAGGVTEGFDVNNNPYLTAYHPETTWNYELGLKTTFADRAHLNVAAFYLDYRDRLFPTFQFQGAQFVQVTTNIGPSKNYGLETDLSFELIPRLVLSASAGFTRAIWGSIPGYQDVDGYTQGGALVLDGGGNPVPQAIDLKGRLAPFTPAYQAALTLDWSHDLTSDWSLGLRANATTYGKEYWDVTDHYRQPAYTLTNLGARLEWKTLTVALNASNVFDTRYNTTFISAAEVGAPNNVGGIGRPRMWNASASFRY